MTIFLYGIYLRLRGSGVNIVISSVPVTGLLAFLLLLSAAARPACAALPKFLGGSGFGVGGKKANIEGQYPSYWDNLMTEQSYANIVQGLQQMSLYKYKEAADSFAKAVIKNPQEAYPHIFLGMALYWQGQVDAAMAEYKTALQIAPDSDEGRQLLGIAYAWKGDINAALKEFQKAVEINPKRADAQMNLGSTQAALGNLEEALFRFRTAVNLDKRHPLYQYQLGALYERLGRDGPAQEAFKKAISLYPNYEEAILALAVLYEKTGQNNNAEAGYNRALKIKPGDSVARLRLANYLAKQNRKDDAMDILSRGFLISPLSNEGLGLSISYAGAGAGGQSHAQQDKQLDQFKKRLSQVPSARQIHIEVEVNLTPKLAPAQIDAAPQGDAVAIRQPSALAGAMEAQDKLARQATFSRSFILAAATDEERQEQLENIFEGFKNVLENAGRDYEVNMALRAGAPVTDTSTIGGAQQSGLGPTASGANMNAKAGYNPYMVGNDMGLWTPNKSWVTCAEEALAEITARPSSADARDGILAAFAYMTLGRGQNALEHFTAAAAAVEDDKLRQIAGLGLGTAHIILGDEDAAASEYKKVLQINPKNEIASANLQVLEK
jgi:tetratricopeptide (TPR) repeat protein